MTTLKVETHKHGTRQVVLSIAGTVCALAAGLSIAGLQLLGQGGNGTHAGTGTSLPPPAAITRSVESFAVSDQEMYSRHRAAAERHAAELGLVSDEEMHSRTRAIAARVEADRGATSDQEMFQRLQATPENAGGPDR
jgi:hypothetical protein